MTCAATIFSHSITPRLQYIVDFLSQYYGLPFRLTSAEEKYQQASGCKINYSYHRLSEGEIYIHPHALLSESYIRQVKIECFTNEGNTASYPAFFRIEGDVHFDLFAAIFYLLTRYEEYLPHAKDSYGRFSHQNSVAFRNNFLHLPLINIWLEDFRVLLSSANAEFSERKSHFSFQATYDIDMAWSFRNKGFTRNAGAMMLLGMKAQFGKLAKRIRVLRRKEPDPFDAYEWMDALHRQYGLDPVYFFLVAKEKSRYDKNIDVGDPEFRSLVHAIASTYKIGLHPSWASGDLPGLLTKEKFILEKLSGQPVHASRQHFIRFSLPASFERLIGAGITEEYSMGYGSINGFRASVATPYSWFNLKTDQATQLMIHPFCFMDANSFYEQKQGPEAAGEELKNYLSEIKAVDGKMITIWHNSFLGTESTMKGWRQVYEQFIASVSTVLSPTG